MRAHSRCAAFLQSGRQITLHHPATASLAVCQQPSCRRRSGCTKSAVYSFAGHQCPLTRVGSRSMASWAQTPPRQHPAHERAKDRGECSWKESGVVGRGGYKYIWQPCIGASPLTAVARVSAPQTQRFLHLARGDSTHTKRSAGAPPCKPGLATYSLILKSA